MDAADTVIACPRELERRGHGGTWRTFAYALRSRRRTLLVLADGRVIDHPAGR